MRNPRVCDMRSEAAEPGGEDQSCDRCGVCRLRIGAGGCARRQATDEAARAEAAAGETAEAVAPLRRSA